MNNSAVFAPLLVLLPFAAVAQQDPPEFTAIDITGWTPSQQEALGVFRRWVPADQAGAPGGFVGEARNGGGIVAGSDIINSTFVQANAVVISNGVAESFVALGSFAWQRTEWDGTDYHFYNGFVKHSHAYDANCNGRVVGDSTVSGSGAYSYEHDAHAVVADPGGSFTDLSPSAHRAAATGINNAGEIVLWIGEGFGKHGFRRLADGSMVQLDGLGGATSPERITESGLVVGSGSDGVTPRTKAFISSNGPACFELPLPDTGPATDAIAVDANEAGWVVGDTWDYTQPVEHYANVWMPSADAQIAPDGWASYDLNELLVTPDVLLERGIAVAEDGRIIARGRPDGTDAFGTRLYLLEPTFSPDTQRDLDASGTVDTLDLIEMLRRFDAGDAAADYDGSTELDAFDIRAFIGGMSAMCD